MVQLFSSPSLFVCTGRGRMCRPENGLHFVRVSAYVDQMSFHLLGSRTEEERDSVCPHSWRRFQTCHTSVDASRGWNRKFPAGNVAAGMKTDGSGDGSCAFYFRKPAGVGLATLLLGCALPQSLLTIQRGRPLWRLHSYYPTNAFHPLRNRVR